MIKYYEFLERVKNKREEEVCIGDLKLYEVMADRGVVTVDGYVGLCQGAKAIVK